VLKSIDVLIGLIVAAERESKFLHDRHGARGRTVG
jgi:hypothetical protein